MTAAVSGLNTWAKKFVEGEQLLVFTIEVAHVFPNGTRKLVDAVPVCDPSVKKVESGKNRDVFIPFHEDETPL